MMETREERIRRLKDLSRKLAEGSLYPRENFRLWMRSYLEFRRLRAKGLM